MERGANPTCSLEATYVHSIHEQLPSKRKQYQYHVSSGISHCQLKSPFSYFYVNRSLLCSGQLESITLLTILSRVVCHPEQHHVPTGILLLNCRPVTHTARH